jgi:hypothetical protein
MQDTRLIIWAAVLLVPLLLWALLFATLPRRLGELYREHFGAPRRERLFLASLSFYLTFALVRAITHAIHAGVGPFHNISAGGLHIHHLVWGILLLLLVGYLWLIGVGVGAAGSPAWLSRATALGYGVGAALTLDEFALWLRLEDVYWARQGRESVRAVMLFGAFLSVGLLGGPFFRAIIRELSHGVPGRGRRQV